MTATPITSAILVTMATNSAGEQKYAARPGTADMGTKHLRKAVPGDDAELGRVLLNAPSHKFAEHHHPDQQMRIARSGQNMTGHVAPLNWASPAIMTGPNCHTRRRTDERCRTGPATWRKIRSTVPHAATHSCTHLFGARRSPEESAGTMKSLLHRVRLRSSMRSI